MSPFELANEATDDATLHSEKFKAAKMFFESVTAKKLVDSQSSVEAFATMAASAAPNDTEHLLKNTSRSGSFSKFPAINETPLTIGADCIAQVVEEMQQPIDEETLPIPTSTKSLAPPSIASPLSMEYVSKRIRKLSIVTPASISAVQASICRESNALLELAEPLEAPNPFDGIPVTLPIIDYSDLTWPVRDFVRKVKGKRQFAGKSSELFDGAQFVSFRENEQLATCSCKLHMRPKSSLSRVSCSELDIFNRISRSRGTMIVRLQKAVLNDWQAIPQPHLENGHLLVNVALGDQSFEMQSLPLDANQRTVCFAAAEDHQLLMSETCHDPQLQQQLVITVFFHDEEFLRARKKPAPSFKSFKSFVGRLSSRKSTASRASSVFRDAASIDMTDDAASSVFSSKTLNSGAEMLIGRTQLDLRSESFKDLYSNKILELEIRFDNNTWLESIKLACCFVNAEDFECTPIGAVNPAASRTTLRSDLRKSVVLPKPQVPRSLSQCALFFEYQQPLKAVFKHELVSMRSAAQPLLVQRLAILDANVLTIYERKTREMCYELRIGAAECRIVPFTSESTGLIPYTLRIVAKIGANCVLWTPPALLAPNDGGTQADRDFSWIDFVFQTKAAYAEWLELLRRVQKHSSTVPSFK